MSIPESHPDNDPSTPDPGRRPELPAGMPPDHLEKRQVPPGSPRAFQLTRGWDGQQNHAVRADYDEVPVTAEEHYWTIHKEIAALHRTKGSDVGHPDDPLANLRASAAYNVPPWVHCIIQCDENLRRVQAFLRNGCLADKDCKVENAVIDLANYAMLGLALYREQVDRERAGGCGCDLGQCDHTEIPQAVTMSGHLEIQSPPPPPDRRVSER